MNRAEEAVRAIDRLQQRVPWLAFPVAVWKKFSDDQAGNLAALLAYYSFVSVFPLLLVFMTVLEIVLRDFPSLREDLINSTIAQFPVVGDQLVNPDHALHETGPALVIGLVLTFLGARGVANAAQNALNTVWAVPYSRRPGFPWNQLRSAGLIVAVGLGLVLTTTLSTIASGSTASVLGPAASYGAVALSLLLNIGVFWLGFRLGTARPVKTRELLFAAVLSAITWQVLQLAGGYIIRHEIAHASAVGGAFAIVLGLLTWLYLQAQFTLYALEAAVVRARGLWPRSLVQPPLTPQDRRAYEMYISAEQRRPEQMIQVEMDKAGRTGPGG